VTSFLRFVFAADYEGGTLALRVHVALSTWVPSAAASRSFDPAVDAEMSTPVAAPLRRFAGGERLQPPPDVAVLPIRAPDAAAAAAAAPLPPPDGECAWLTRESESGRCFAVTPAGLSCLL
jgi:hypothetical protein